MPHAMNIHRITLYYSMVQSNRFDLTVCVERGLQRYENFAMQPKHFPVAAISSVFNSNNDFEV